MGSRDKGAPSERLTKTYSLAWVRVTKALQASASRSVQTARSTLGGRYVLYYVCREVLNNENERSGL